MFRAMHPETRLHRLTPRLSRVRPPVRTAAPFDARICSRPCACRTILPSHQHRHLRQAAQVRNALSAA